MLGPIEDHRTIGDTIGEIIVIAVVSALMAVGLFIWVAGGSDKILSFDAGAIEAATSTASASGPLDTWEDFEIYRDGLKTDTSNTQSQP